MQYKLENFIKAQNSYKENTPIQALMRQKLIKMLDSTNEIKYNTIFEFGCGQGELTFMLSNRLIYKNYICNDINNYDCKPIENTTLKYFDMNLLHKEDIFNQKFDLIASNACLQWLDFYKTINNIAKMLNKDGILLIGTFGINNLKEIKHITKIGLPYIESKSMQEHIAKRFDCIAWHEENITINFTDSISVFRHLKYGGVNSITSKYIKKSWLTEYEKLFNNNLTYHIICFLVKLQYND